MPRVAAQVQLVVKRILTASSKSVGPRSIRPLPLCQSARERRIAFHPAGGGGEVQVEGEHAARDLSGRGRSERPGRGHLQPGAALTERHADRPFPEAEEVVRTCALRSYAKGGRSYQPCDRATASKEKSEGRGKRIKKLQLSSSPLMNRDS